MIRVDDFFVFNIGKDGFVMKKIVTWVSFCFLFTLFALSPQNAANHIALAAQAPSFVTLRTYLYENGDNDGTYTYTVKNLKKGYKVKWSVAGSGSSCLSFEKSVTKASKPKVSNRIFVDTGGFLSAKNKKAVITAQVYDKEGRLVKKLTDSVTLKVNSTFLQIATNKIQDSLTALAAKTSYDFDCRMAPANATSQLYWKVTTLSGTDCSSQITEDGVWTPLEKGSYYVQAYTKNSTTGRVISSTRIQATVGTGSTTVTAGKPVSAVILTTTVPVKTASSISYALYDSNGIDVTSSYKSKVSFSGVVPSGSLSSAGSLYMDTLGEYASVTLTYQNGSEKFTANANILCGSSSTGEIRTTITSTSENPSFENATLSTDNSFYLGDTAYFHFEVTSGSAVSLTYSNPRYFSQNTSVFTVDGTGKLTGIQPGSGILSVTCTVNQKQMTYQTRITVLPRRTASVLSLGSTSLTLSNVKEAAYQKTISVSVTDQYNNPVSQALATASITEASGKAVLAKYDSATGQITVAAQGAIPGTYTYTLTLSVGGSQLKAGFQVIVQAVPENGIETYLAEANTVFIDTKTSDRSPQPFEISVARYVNGIFGGYATIQSATVEGSLGWYGEDLTSTAKKKSQKIYPIEQGISLIASYPLGDSEASTEKKTAKPGTYTVTLTYTKIGEATGKTAEDKQLILVVK